MLWLWDRWRLAQGVTSGRLREHVCPLHRQQDQAGLCHSEPSPFFPPPPPPPHFLFSRGILVEGKALLGIHWHQELLLHCYMKRASWQQLPDSCPVAVSCLQPPCLDSRSAGDVNAAACLGGTELTRSHTALLPAPQQQLPPLGHGFRFLGQINAR